ncbi:MAG: hypothetical protein WCJ67_09685 [Thermoleophilia bacterium]
MGGWYEIGITVGVGVAAGIALAGVLAGLRFGFAATILGSVVSGIVAGVLVNGWLGAGGGVIGGVIGAASAVTIARGATRRGATSGGVAIFLVGAALAVGLLALVPVVGYLEAIVLPFLAMRRARANPDKVAGLRSLAR